MGDDFPKPYSIDEIVRHPMAVAFSIVVGLLVISVGINIQKDHACTVRENELIDKADKEKTERIQLYESLLFYKQKSEKLEVQQNQTDSSVRQETQSFVHKILKDEK